MILIINSAGTYDEKNSIEKNSRELPNGSAVVVGGLRKQGFKVMHKDLRNLVSPCLSQQLTKSDFDAFLKHDQRTPMMNEYLSLAFSVLPDLAQVKLLGFSVFSHINYLYALALAKEIHNLHPSLQICMGGAFITIRIKNIPPFINYIIKGNGTGPLVHLANHCIHQHPLNNNFPGIWHVQDGKLIENGINQEAADLEALPDYSDFDLDRYLFDMPNSSQKYLKVPYRTSLGCTNSCSFCTGKLVDPSLRFKSVDKVVSEIKTLNSLHENVLIRFSDASINNSSKIISHVMDAFIKDNYKFKWRAFAKIHDMNDELLEKFARTGCESLIWGIENASPHMIEVFNKRFDINVAEKIINKASSLGIQSVIYLIFNGPNETYEDLLINETFINKMFPAEHVTFDLFDFYLEEGSPFHRFPEKYGIEILERENQDDFTIRENIRWKEANLSWEEFDVKQRMHYEKKLSLMEYCNLR